MKKLLLTFTILSFLFTSCYNEDLINAEDQLIAVSQVDQSFPFKNQTTFSVTDTITEIYIDAVGKEVIKKSWAGNVKSLIRTQMEERGYQYIEMNSATHPNLIFELTYIENKYVTVYNYGWWYQYYEPYWYNSWDWPYNPYYPIHYTYVTSYIAKSFIMDCLYENTIDPKNKTKSCFFGLVRGIADQKYADAEVASYIKQCFDQTPELSKN